MRLTAELIRDCFEQSDLLYFWRLYKVLSSIDVMPMPMKLVEEVCGSIIRTFSDVASSREIPDSLKLRLAAMLDNIWGTYEKYGTQVAALLKTDFNSLEDLLKAISKITKLLAVRRLEIKKLDQGTMELMAIGPSDASEISNKNPLLFIKGFVDYYGYEITSQDVRANVLRIVLKRKPQPTT